MAKKSFFSLAVITISIFMLSSCGIKPSNVDAPDGAENIVFPANYPTQKEEEQ